VSQQDKSQRGLGMVLEDSASFSTFREIVTVKFMSRVIIALTLSGLTELAPHNTTKEALKCYFEKEISPQDVKEIER
jgi:hypothetical protein